MDKKTITPKSKLRMEIKEISADGSFEGLLSPYGNVDGGGDVVEPGAYTKTLKERGSKVPLLWQHKSDTPIGELTLDDRKDGLWCKGQLLMELPEAQKAYLLIKSRIVKGLSIGFSTIKDAIANGVRRLLELKLYEGSIVTFPMNEMAMITNVKADGETKDATDFNQALNEAQLADAGYQMRCALSSALSSLFWSGLTRDEMLTLASTIIDQFAEAYLAYLPNYIDMLTQYYGDVETWAAKRHEQKAGAAISASNAEKIRAACEMITSGRDNLLALVEGKAGETTLSTKAADEPKPEPVSDDHSATERLIEEIKAALQ